MPYALFKDRELVNTENLESHYGPEEIRILVEEDRYIHVSRKVARRLQKQLDKKKFSNFSSINYIQISFEVRRRAKTSSVNQILIYRTESNTQ